MDLSDDRGQALQVGAILLFGILVVGLALYQATIVPTQNERVEFESYLDANGDMERLDSEIGAAAARDYSTRTAVQTGVRYPSRTLFVNPGPAANRLRTGDPQTVRIANASAVNGEETNTRTHWNGTTREYETTSVRFDTRYNQLQVPPIRYESSTLYRPADRTAEAPYGPNESIVMADGAAISGGRITLIAVDGELDVGGMRSSVVARPVSAHSRTVVVTGNDTEGENIRLTVPSQLANETWEEEIVSGEIAAGDVLRVEPGSNDASVDVVLNGSRTFELRLAKVELRRPTDSNRVDSTEPRYVIAAAGDGQSISVAQSTRVTVEVRDRYNNPKSGVTVYFSTADGTLASDSATTNSEGRASVQFDPNTTGETTVTATMNGADGGLNTTRFSIFAANNPDAITINAVEGFQKKAGPDEWSVSRVEIRDSDGDDDLERVEYEITDSAGTVRATRTDAASGRQYLERDVTISPDDPNYDVRGEKTYTLTVTAYDSDGNVVSAIRTA